MTTSSVDHKFRIRTLNAISGAGLSRLPDELYEVGGSVEEPDALLVRSAKLHDTPIEESVLAVARAGAGTNNIPVEALTERGVPVFNTPGANANAVKELVLAGLFIASRNLIPAARFAHTLEGDDAEIAKAVEAGKKQFVGFELPGRTLGVIGLGAIGVQVANAALGLGLNVVGFDPGISVEHAWHLSAEVERADSMEEVFRRADILTVHVPLIPATRGLVSTQRLALMKETAVLLNFARAEIVDTDAVVAAGGNGFMSVSATHAALLLAQGAGRLIRRSQDRGVVAVLDSRLRTARYGGFLTRSMPALWPTTKPDVVRAALRRLAVRTDAPVEE